MVAHLTQADLEIFSIPQFKDRMTALKTQLRPKLEAFGEELSTLLEQQFKQDFFSHTAKHLRRTVNPPDETWVALGPQVRGYKGYVYFALCVGRQGAQARVVLKQESEFCSELGKNLLANREFFLRHRGDFEALQNFAQRDEQGQGRNVDSFEGFFETTANRLLRLKSAYFDAGLPLKALSSSLLQDAVRSFDILFPFYECGLRKGVLLR